MRGHALRPVLAAATSLVLTACQETITVQPTGNAAVLIGVPVAFADSVFVVLGRSVAGGPAVGEPGAHLVLRIGDDPAVSLEEGSPGACGRPTGFSCYAARTAGRVRPGDAVRLEGSLRGGGRILGDAVVPPVPDIRVAGGTAGDTVRGRSLSDSTVASEVLGVKEVEGRVGVGDTVVMATVWRGGEALLCPVHLPGPPPGVDLREGSRVGVGAAPPDCPVDPDLVWDSMAVPVTFLSYDENFTAWAGPRPPLTAADAGEFGVEGAAGVWGAATPRTFVLVVTP